MNPNVVEGSDWLQYPSNAKGIGELIRQPGAKQLIAGVQLEAGALHPDDRGYFMEIHRMGKGLAAHYDAATTQISMALSYPGTIKAFHYHLKQTDFWALNIGLSLMALLTLLPLGVLQLSAALEHGYWYARSAEFMGRPLIHLLVWMRVPGDTIFACGALAFAWFVFRLWVAPKRAAVGENSNIVHASI